MALKVYRGGQTMQPGAVWIIYTLMFGYPVHFAALIKTHLDRAIAAGASTDLDTEVVAWAWFGAINEIVVRWLVSGQPERLEDALPTVRKLLLRSVGAEPAREGQV
jgi:hypothetical protein